MRRTDFTVEGIGEFPIDMLRYDQCWPVDAQAVRNITFDSGRRTVKLATNLYYSPNANRWESFGWKVKTVDKD